MWKFKGGYLESPSGKRWRARSGPYGNGPLPAGFYEIGTAFEVEPPEQEKGAYQDVAGLAWFCRLRAKFATERTGLGIHPDGNIPGTRGCIGLTDEDTSGAYIRLRLARTERLEVKP